MKLPTTPEGKPVLDEASFQRLLAAAYVIQQHHERMRAAEEATRAVNETDPDYAHTLAEVVEIQQQIQMRRLDLDGAAGFVVEQIRRITGAAGAAVGLLDRNHLVYRAVSGLSAAELGSALPKREAASSSVLEQGIVLRCPSVRQESRLRQAMSPGSGIASFVSVPIFHDDQVAGAIELAFDAVNGFNEYDVHTCQLMAGLVTEALARAADETLKRNLTAERDSMLQALEKLKPQLDQLAKDAEHLSSTAMPSLAQGGALKPMTARMTIEPAIAHRESSRPSRQANAAGSGECAKCGNPLSDQEVYCGSCGTLRPERPTNGNKNSAVAPAFDDNPLDLEGPTDPRPLSERMPKPEFDLPPEVLALVQQEPTVESGRDVADELLKLLPPEDWEGKPTLKTAQPVETPNGYPWTSAANARAWLNSMSDPQAGTALMELARKHRGDISLVAAILLVLVAIFWSRTDRVQPPSTAVTSINSPSNTGNAVTPQSEPDPQAQLSLWDRALIGLGLAEAPATPVAPTSTGNPEINVWVDMHTALYYCPGSDLYGKTQKGRYITQREAQSERFEPASGKFCE